MESRARQLDEANLALQREAAALRLAREVGRLLCCLDGRPDNLAAELATQAGRTGPLAERLREAGQRLNGRFPWEEHLAWELEKFVKRSSTNDRQSRLSGSSLNAALADYRWSAAV
jgi:hypothetical protein